MPSYWVHLKSFSHAFLTCHVPTLESQSRTNLKLFFLAVSLHLPTSVLASNDIRVWYIVRFLQSLLTWLKLKDENW